MEISEIQPTLNVYRPNGGPRTFDYNTTVEQWTEFVKKKDERNPFDKIVFIVHGFMNSAHAEWMIEMKDALYAESGRKVVVLVGWGKGAYFDGYPTEYFNAMENMELVGKWLAPYVQVMKQECPDNFVHGVGHSLGAHLLGFTARNSNKAFDRITGLDPAGPWFEKTHPEKMLKRTDSRGMVDIIHTDGLLDVPQWIKSKESSILNTIVDWLDDWIPDIPFIDVSVEKVHLGTMVPLGNLDFYPNFGVTPQPGTVVVPSSTPGANSHSRAHELFTWSIQHPEAFKTHAALEVAPTYEDAVKATAEARKEAQMGYFADNSQARNGNYYLRTKDKVPWE